MTALRLQLMCREALCRLRDADSLSDVIGGSGASDSPYLLRLLGFELLLKAIFEAALSKTAHGHNYERLFKELPVDLQARLLLIAGERIGPSALTLSHETVLQQWGKNFIAVRYPWEKYSNQSSEEYLRRGVEWLGKGALVEEAAFCYYPEELAGFLFALRAVSVELIGEE